MEETLKEIELIVLLPLRRLSHPLDQRRLLEFLREMIEWRGKSSEKMKIRENFGKNWNWIDEMIEMIEIRN